MFNLKRLTQFLWIIAFSSFLGIANTLACTAKIVYNWDEVLPDTVEAGQSVTLKWYVKNTSSCDAVDYRLAFYSSTPSSSSSNFGGSSHPTFTINAGDTGWIPAEFTAPQETGYFSKVIFDILDENGTPLPAFYTPYACLL